MAKLIYPELSYKIVAALYEVQKNLGGGYQEKYYQKALVREFSLKKINCKGQLPIELKYKNESLGRYFLDFLIENKIILEIKSDCKFYSRDIKQVLAYLKAKNLELGILACFGKRGLIYKRILKGKKL
jgi:GxxExxY protein